MISGLKPRSDMKDSGIDWLGDVPAHWSVRRFKHWLLVNESTLSEDTQPDFTFDYLDIGTVGTGCLVAPIQRIQFQDSPSRARRVVRQGDTIVSMVRTYLKAIWHARDVQSDLIASTGFAVLTPTQTTCSEFVSYVCQSSYFTDRVSANSVGVAYPAIAETKFSAFEVAVPPLSEQTAIARFLDHATGLLDRYIRAKEKLIALLEEQKQVIVNEAVTGRIDVRTGKPYPAYKPSGVEWLGDVPTHWEARRLGQIGILLKGGGGSKEDETHQGVPCVRYGDLYTTHTWSISQSRSCVSHENAANYTRIQYGDVLFAASGETIGDIGKSAVNLMRSKACCGGDIILFRSNSRDRPLDPCFMGYATDCRFAAAQKAKMGRGFTVVHIYPQQIKQVTLALPPLSEQVRIACFLDGFIASLNSAINCTVHEIELLREYRTRLIADVVTGKLDVREAALRLPDNADAPAQESGGIEPVLH